VYFAIGNATAPYQITSGGIIYAQNELDATSSPPPADCQIGVSLRYGASITNLNTIETEYTGWKACPTLLFKGITTPAYACIPSPGKTNFYTTGVTELITPQGNTLRPSRTPAPLAYSAQPD
jgi:hypothetical protein